MRFIIDEEIFDRFPGLHVGLVIARNLDNRGECADVMRHMRDREKSIRNDFDLDTLSQHPKIAAWRGAYSLFGAKPKKHKSSVESLYRMVLKGMELRHINKVVDVYNYISIKHMVPVGGDDADKVDGDIRLMFARGNEPFVPLNSQDLEQAREGEVVYKDDQEVLCRRWNWRECDKSKLTPDTRKAVLVIEGLPPVLEKEVNEAAEDMSRSIKKCCGGKTDVRVLSAAYPGADIS